MMACRLPELLLKSLFLMPVKTFRPLTPSLRYVTFRRFQRYYEDEPEKGLVVTRKKTGGRNHYGRVTTRGLAAGTSRKSGSWISSATSTAWRQGHGN